MSQAGRGSIFSDFRNPKSNLASDIQQIGVAVITKVFANWKLQFDDACIPLRAFTLGMRGSSRQDGIAAMEHLAVVCDRITTLFASGPHAGAAAAMVASGRGRTLAAAARLALLERKRNV